MVEPVFYLDWLRIAYRGWFGGAKVLGRLPVPGRPTNLNYSRARAYVLAVGAVGVVWTFFVLSITSLFFLRLSGRRSDID